MLDYKLSHYNFVFPYHENDAGEKQMVLYNTKTGSMALIEDAKYKMYCDFESDGKPIEDEELLSNLRLGGFVVDSDFDELVSLRHTMLSSRYSDTGLCLTIAPTSDCNFRCVYCYEKDNIKPVVMNDEVKNAIVEFVKSRIPFIRNLSINWYGGEPLLAMDIIEELSRKFMEMCEENKVEYYASIVTNGFLLTPKIMDKLNELKVVSMQITLDGAAEDHDKRRCLKGGLPTFDRIIDNLVAVKDKIQEPISIRINADRHNVDRVDNVVSVLKEKGLEDVTAPYIAMVENANGTYNDNSCLHTNEFSKHEFEFITRNGLDILHRIPRQIGNYCGADSGSSFVIGADGLIYECWNEIGMKELSIGKITEGIVEGSHTFKYMMYDPTEDEECRDCKFLPVCMGGCPYLRQHNPDIRCTSMKHGLAAFMDVIPAILEKNVDSQKAQNDNEESV